MINTIDFWVLRCEVCIVGCRFHLLKILNQGNNIGTEEKCNTATNSFEKATQQ